MKILQKLMFVFTITLLLYACSDIVDSDKNILITEIKYNSIKADQENSVLLPLKAGNKWYYDVYQYKIDGSIESYLIDSIEVIKEVNLQNEKWFEIYFPMLSDKNLYVSNTDIGLWVKCDDCTNNSFNLVKYPTSSGSFVSGYPEIYNLPIQNFGHLEYLQTLLITKTIENENITVPLGNFDCIKYTSHFESDSIIINQNPMMNEYYSVDKGLIKMEQYYLLNDKIAKTYELRDDPGIEDWDDCSETLDIDVGDIENNTIHKEQIQLVNNSNNTIRITFAFVETESQAGTIVISPYFLNPPPLELLPGESINMSVDINPNQLSRFFGVIKVIALGCFYEITITGISI